MPAICLDTQVLIWGVREQATPGQESMIQRAKAMLRGGDGVEFLIPSVVVGEFLTPVPADLHPTVLNLMRETYSLPSYDVRAAAIAARLWQDRSDDGTIRELREGGVSRTKIKADIQIVATALAQSVDYIISHDGDLRRIARDEIEVRDIPTGSEQLELIEGDEDPES